MMKKAVLLAFLLCKIHSFYAQTGTQRLNFAKTYFEAGTSIYPSFNSTITAPNTGWTSFKTPATATPMLHIGGYHFWGHADFYISIPLGSFPLTTNRQSVTTVVNESAVTGLRYLPLAYKPGRLTPFAGGAWIVSNFKQSTDGNNNPMFARNEVRLDAGLLFGNTTWQMRCGLNYYPQSRLKYPIADAQFQTIERPRFSAVIGLVYAVETSSKGMKQDEIKRLNGFNSFSTPPESASPKGDWFAGIGPSSAFILSGSAYNQSVHPSFNPKSISKTYLDGVIGYHFNHARVVTNLSFRRIPFTEKAFGEKQTIVKNSLIAESFYFLTDYHGFTPYLGVHLGYDKITITENKSQVLSTLQWTPGITFGWDILPNKTEQPFVLRTNLRWVPFQHVDIEGHKHSLHQLEYNVIQAVWYPSRHKRIKH